MESDKDIAEQGLSHARFARRIWEAGAFPAFTLRYKTSLVLPNRYRLAVRVLFNCLRNSAQ